MKKLCLAAICFFLLDIFLVIGIFINNASLKKNSQLSLQRRVPTKAATKTETSLFTQLLAPVPQVKGRADKPKQIIFPTRPPQFPPTTTPSPVAVSQNTVNAGFYERFKQLYNQRQFGGQLHSQLQPEPFIDINSEASSVHIGLKYPSIGETITDEDKSIILNDFLVIQSLAKEDKNLIDPGSGKLNLFVITFHDRLGNARGDLQQTAIDNEPIWDFWE